MSPICQAVIRRVEKYPGNAQLLAVEAPEIASSCRPGQFVMVSLQQPLLYPSPLLKRALAIYSTESHAGGPDQITLLSKVVGEGTALLSTARPGDKLDLVGPLGNGFTWESEPGCRHIIVAGGIGIASVFLLASKLHDAGQNVHLIYGARTADELLGREDFEHLGIRVLTTTEDGSHGQHGLVTDGLRQLWNEIEPSQSRLYACGPNPMMEAVCQLARQHRVPCRISVEVKMACGFGVCLGCSVKTTEGYRLACTHGPVFDGDQFVWEPHLETVRSI